MPNIILQRCINDKDMHLHYVSISFWSHFTQCDQCDTWYTVKENTSKSLSAVRENWHVPLNSL